MHSHWCTFAFDFFLLHIDRDSSMLLSISVVHVFVFQDNIPSYDYHVLIHSFTDGHLGCFQFGAILNKAAMNILTGSASSWVLCTLLESLVCATNAERRMARLLGLWLQWQPSCSPVSAFSRQLHWPRTYVPLQRESTWKMNVCANWGDFRSIFSVLRSLKGTL